MNVFQWCMKPFKTAIQLWRYHNSIDVEKALWQRYQDGIRYGKKQISVHPYCDLHNDPQYDTPLVVLMPGVFGCEQCRKISEPALPVRRPTIHLAESLAEQPHGKLGPDTSLHLAIRLIKEGQTGVMHKIGQIRLPEKRELEDVPTRDLKEK